jgi:hypothetical protein
VVVMGVLYQFVVLLSSVEERFISFLP